MFMRLILPTGGGQRYPSNAGPGVQCQRQHDETFAVCLPVIGMNQQAIAVLNEKPFEMGQVTPNFDRFGICITAHD